MYRVNKQARGKLCYRGMIPGKGSSIVRLPRLKPGGIREERSRGSKPPWDMFGAQPRKHTIKIDCCILDWHIAKDRANANDVDSRVPQEKDQRGPVVNLCTRRAQPDICIHIHKFFVHSVLKEECTSNTLPFLLCAEQKLRRFFHRFGSFLGAQLRPETTPRHAERYFAAQCDDDQHKQRGDVGQ